MGKQVHRASILHFPRKTTNPSQNYQYFSDGVLVVENGKVSHIGAASEFFTCPDNRQLLNYGGVTLHKGLIIPGMIDSHAHFPQIEMMASFGKQLLDWLNQYTFPTEKKFANADYAFAQAQFFIEQLFAHGTTTASVFATVHPQSVDAFFSVAEHHQARMICGKVLMDSNCPDDLKDDPKTGYYQSKALIERWHNHERSLYAITPRFAPTSSEAQLRMAGLLASEHSDTFIQTHLSENTSEVEWVKTLFPAYKDYTSVYAQNGLVRERALFAHAIHLSQSELNVLSSNGASISFCPSSNLFLGSGLFNLERAKSAGVGVSIASDVGAGTSLSLLSNQADAYKVCQLNDTSLDPFEALYLCTQGAASSMGIDHLVGNLNPGTEADFVELNFMASPILAQRMLRCQNLSEQLFALTTLSDERVIESTYVHGNLVYNKGMKICGQNSPNGLRSLSNGSMSLQA